MEIQNKNVLVFGTGISGIGACHLLATVDAKITLYDSNENCDKEEIKKRIPDAKVTLLVGEMTEQEKEAIDLVVLSPGVPTDLALVEEFRKRNIPIWGEVELAYRFGKGDVLAITGTNGKTTTTALLGEIMKAYYNSVFVVGNIGIPYTELATQMTNESVVVAELSSFQLETVHEFVPKVSAILNISPDHLNRHHTMDAYIEAKKNIARKQIKEQVCVLNYEDEVTRAFGQEIDAQVIYFSSKRRLEKGIFLEDHKIIYKDKEEVLLCDTRELKLLGIHNFENAMAAAAMALAYGVPAEVVTKVLKEFAGVAHRIEFVCEKNGVHYYNDSKGTNPDAAIKGIQAMNRSTILLGGGYDKDSSYEEWIESFEGKVKYFVLTGQTREKIQAAASRCGFEQTVLVEDFDEAVLTCAKLAKEGDAVLLSPACASWGVFRNFEERGDRFKEIVKGL